MRPKKLVCLGGGSLYFRRALGDLVTCEELARSEIVLYDLDGEKVELMAALGRRLAQEAGTEFSIRSTVDLADAVDGAHFAISSIGGSGAEATPNVYGSYYHSADMHIAARYGIYQIVGDTGGPAGMMMALRSIPAYVEICREMEKRCPNVLLFNHSNPMAVLCRAMNKYTSISVIGICHGVQASIAHVAKFLGLSPEELDCTWVGTNHYYWFLKVAHKGVDLTEQLMQRIVEHGGADDESLCDHLSRAYGYAIGYPGEGHLLDLYPYAAQLRSQGDLPDALVAEAVAHGFDESRPMPRKQPVTEQARAQFLRQYQTILDKVKLPEKGQTNYIIDEGLAAMIAAIAHGRREVFIVNIPNNGLIPNLPATAVIEVDAVTDSTGVRGVQVGECPLHLKGILEKRFAWQELVADAAVNGDRNLALQALLLDELAIWPDKAEAMLDELLAASKDMLPRFFGSV